MRPILQIQFITPLAVKGRPDLALFKPDMNLITEDAKGLIFHEPKDRSDLLVLWSAIAFIKYGESRDEVSLARQIEEKIEAPRKKAK